MTLKEILEYHFLTIGDFRLSLYHIIIAILIITMARMFVWMVSKVMMQYFKRKKVDSGRQYALMQFLKYIVYTIALLMALEAIGISLSVLWGGAAALMVGIGLGLQQTFNDLVSGIILLVEGAVEVDDIVEVDGVIGRVIAIGLRTSQVETRDAISLLIPNSKLVGEKATNWSHNPSPTRFKIAIGVAYSSDIEQVTSLLLQSVEAHQSILATPAPQVQFVDFGSSSLDFVLYFYSHEYWKVELIKSELRYKITRLFREHDIEIPFPQQDLWLRNSVDLQNRSSPAS